MCFNQLINLNWYNILFFLLEFGKKGDAVPPVMKKQDYADRGFQSRTVFKGDKYAY